MKRKCALITGGSSNIGEGIAIELARKGYDLAITYSINKTGAANVKAECEAYGVRCFVYQVFLDEPVGPAEVVDKAHNDLGHLDLLVCNAGGGISANVLNAEEKQIDDVYALNYRAYMLCTGAAARWMIRDHIQGCIILIGSSQGEQAYPSRFSYCGMKAGINQSCKCLALDLSHYNIRVNVVSPGQVRSQSAAPSPRKMENAKKNHSTTFNAPIEVLNQIPFTKHSVPLHRVGEPKDIAKAVAFLADEDASFITGITLRIDGGLVLPGIREGETKLRWAEEGYWRKEAEAAGLKDWIDMPVKKSSHKPGCVFLTEADTAAGKEIALAFLRAGYDIAVTYEKKREDILPIITYAEQIGRRCFAYQGRIGVSSDICSMIEQGHKDLGWIDVAVFQADKQCQRSVLNISVEDIDGMYQSYFRAFLLGAGAASRCMVGDGIPGRILFFTSIRANRAYPEDFLYCGMMAALEHACKAAALDLSHYGICVNCISSGMTGKQGIEESIPLRQTETVSDLGKLAVFFAGDSTEHITGETIRCDSGISLPGLLERDEATYWCRDGFWDEEYREAFSGKINF